NHSMSQAFCSTRVLTAAGLAHATFLVEDERIVDISSGGRVADSVACRDFGDLIVLPGLVDSHVHINEPGRTDWEGFATATRAAAAGGYTTPTEMPLNCLPAGT